MCKIMKSNAIQINYCIIENIFILHKIHVFGWYVNTYRKIKIGGFIISLRISVYPEKINSERSL